MNNIPSEVRETIVLLERAGYEAYVVGGCVRDLLLGREPEDWDVATNATPEEIKKIFPDSFYENKFFTVTVQTKSENPKLQEIEVTTYRADFEYGDRRRPGKVVYATTIEEDLSRRDFTVNAIALRLTNDKQLTTNNKNRKVANQRASVISDQLIDPFHGQEDLKKRLIRAVGNPKERFQEDALRMMRAVRIGAVLGFAMEEKTKGAITQHAEFIQEISQERIRDEFVKIIMSERSMEGIELLHELGLLRYIMPELQEGYGVTQNKHHIYTVWEHNLLSLQYATKQKWDSLVRIAALLHDVAKPRVKKGEGPNSTFYDHEVVGAKMVRQILSRLKFARKDIEKVSKLVRYHLFYYNVGEVSESSVRRLMRNVGAEDIDDLLKVRIADRIGSGVPKAEPYKLRHLRYLIEKAAQDPISPKMLKVNGNDIMSILGIAPGPRVGLLLDILLGEALDDPKKNTKKYLESQVQALGQLPEEKLRALALEARRERETVEIKRDDMTKSKYWVT